MGKKLKTGKQRKDRYYHLAKETGYRSRAAFKLIQLNRKFEFLQRSKVLIDLCAAPGGWLQVSQKYMPVSSVIIGVDLVPIKAIHNVITIQSDITTQKCRQQLKGELKTWKADVVMHDGAPNVGKNWIHDSYNQLRLTLSAAHIATDFLIRGGTFVTKVFRSKDYNALMWVLGKLFQKVHATKPQASRHESAEIFVVCQNFLAPEKIDPKFFDPTYLFEDVGPSVESEKKQKANLLKPVTKQKKTKAEGYDDGDYTLYHQLKASDFIKSQNHIELLSKCNEIVIDSPEISNHSSTTNEIIECCRDIKVLGRKDLLLIIGWRRTLKDDLFKEDKNEQQKEKIDGQKVEEIDEIEDEEEDEETKKLKRKKRKILKERKKLNERMNLKMILKNDLLVEDDIELFQLKNIKSNDHLNKVEEVELSDLDIEEDDEDDEQLYKIKGNKRVHFDKDVKEHQLVESDDDNDDDDNDDDDNDDDNSGAFEETIDNDDYDDGDGNNELIVDLNDEKIDKTKMFFENRVFQSEMDNDDDDLELEMIANKLESKRGPLIKNKRKIEDKNDDSDDDSNDSDDEIIEKNKEKPLNDKYLEKCKNLVKLNPESLALGTLMVQSQKAKRDITDGAWNRYTNGDDELLPSWFRKDEERHYRKQLPVTQEMVNEYKQKLREINARPIRKVTEAKARKRKRALRKLEKARKKAENITDAPDMSEREKAEHIKNAYKRALKGNKKDVKYVVSKKHLGKRRPQGVKGKYKLVDPRMKKDKLKQKAAEKHSKRGKRNSKAQKSKKSKRK